MHHDVFVFVDGKRVKVGTATQEADGFTLQLDAMVMTPGAPLRAGPVFPPYGRSKGQPVAGASVGDLDYYAAGCQRTLDDPAKARWHEKERALLDAVQAERAKHGGGFVNGGQAKHTAPQDDALPLSDNDIPF